MNKGKLTLSLLSVAALLVLASCDPLVKSDDGYVMTITSPNGTEIHYTADDLFNQYKGNASGVAKFYEAVVEVVIRNEMNQPGKAGQLAEIMEKAENRVDGVKETARSNADNNKTKYKDELESQFETYGVEDLDELKDHFAYQLMKEKVEENFYDDNKQEMLMGAVDYEGYLDAKLPYHVRHILVKVSDQSTNIYDGAITEQEARNIASVIKRLAIRQNSETFGDIAREASEDTGSAANFGDLGIMSKATSFVNEFKLGVYAYDAIYNQDANVVANAAKLNVPGDSETFLTTLGLGEIPYEAALLLNDTADIVKDSNGDKVNDGDAKYYPRNIYFNKFFNKHNVSVITPTNTDGSANAAYEAMLGFQNVAELGGKKALVDEDGKVILAVRAGTGSGDSGYQGLHFIVVERSALVETSASGVTLEDYYTTEIPNTTSFPKDGSDNDLITYVNFMNTTTKIYKERSETIANEIKGFDTMLQARIFEKLSTAQAVTFADSDLEDAIRNYIAVTRADNAFSEDLNYEQTWDTFVRYLEYQEWQRQRLIDETCAETFLDADTAPEYQSGGVCYVKK
ncbi:MAG: peptidylprolyl isomerase [Bacilli bacterium]